MARQVRQTLPDPPPTYNQEYIAALVRSVNHYMGQAQALAEVTAARYIMTDQPTSTVGLKVGTLYVRTVSGAPVISIVQEGDP
jgi:K+/H+ antiporter YhaU regulatory subunit KhtT